MKIDEYKMLMKVPQDLSPKRKEYVLKKWQKRGWYKYRGFLGNSVFTEEFYRIQDLAINKKKYIKQWDGRVVTVYFVYDKDGCDSVGILTDNGDNGWSLHTNNTCKRNMSYALGDNDFEWVAYAELHPQPHKIWERLNYLQWKHYGRSDYFHQKISKMSWDTVADYSRASEGIYTYSNPHGNIGDCYPRCQCKFL